MIHTFHGSAANGGLVSSPYWSVVNGQQIGWGLQYLIVYDGEGFTLWALPQRWDKVRYDDEDGLRSILRRGSSTANYSWHWGFRIYVLSFVHLLGSSVVIMRFWKEHQIVSVRSLIASHAIWLSDRYILVRFSSVLMTRILIYMDAINPLRLLRWCLATCWVKPQLMTAYLWLVGKMGNGRPHSQWPSFQLQPPYSAPTSTKLLFSLVI